jgi:hypothetical protein
VSQISQSVVNVRKDIERVRAGITTKVNLAESVSVGILESEAGKIADLASKYAPHKTGLLDGSTGAKSFLVERQRGGRGQVGFVVKLNLRKWKMVSGKRVSISDYAWKIHSGFGWENLGKGSRDKARSLGLAINPTYDGKYVGRLFLSRAVNQRRGAITYYLKRAVKEAIE